MGAIVLDHAAKSYGAQSIIRNISLNIKDGEFVVFVGPSGCGKSTLLRMIAGLEELSDGRILIDGQDVSRKAPAERQIAMVFQSYALYPHMTVRENISFGLKIAGFPKPEVTAKVEEAARMLELSHLLDRKPKALSGGQRQRVAIGRAIVRSPRAFLFDEPLSNLDAALRVQMRMEIINLHASLAKTMIYVTHDQVEAMTMADRIVVLSAGRVEQFDTPIALYDAPVNRFVAGFIGSPKMNFLPVTSDAAGLKTVDGTTLPLSGYRAADLARARILGIRPEHLRLNQDGPLWQGTVQVSEQLGSDVFLHVVLPGIDLPLVVRAVDERRFARGDSIGLSPDFNRAFLFDSDDLTLRRA
ncbi:MAG: ABC transporter ATP-binding protein [Cereibacter sphaeroides]|uniref:ABC transporter ATP-binding protein n=1 Tax=Cereibacter sphaeroides TaxID=1063 RepID=A0A2W5RZP1_CERSP|nr:MAG: ABC transporter ATP-binding protein [Cereibacter sphaeroides]